MTAEMTQTAEPPQRAKTDEEIRAMVERNRDMDLTTFADGAGVFGSGASFNLAQRMATALSGSTMIPKDYHGNPGNIMIAIDYAARLKQPLLAFMSHCDIIYGRPALRGKLYIGIINGCGKFSRIKWHTRGGISDEGVPSPDCAYQAYAKEHETGETLLGPWVSWAMVVAEKWNTDKENRNGGGVTKSKWNTMTELMFMYRSAAFWGNTHAPDVTLGLAVEGEVEDTVALDGDFTVVSIGGEKPKATAKRGGRSGATRANNTLQEAIDADEAAAAANPEGASVEERPAKTVADEPATKESAPPADEPRAPPAADPTFDVE